ncbi:MAG: thiamine-phosphate kinase [Acidobacteria bacterium]|nr:MAG: thiamine-phosphate kinase [Acidobacteriota bacterium]
MVSTIDSPEYTEDTFISRLLTKVPTPAGEGFAPGDDAAIIELEGVRFLGCADGLIEGVHFDLGTCSPADAGWKSLAVNLSDIAAMGGTPTSALVVLEARLGEADGESAAQAAYEGLGECARSFGVVISGGDVVSADRLALSVTVLGELPAVGEALLRSGARPGDLVCVTGRLGEAAMALATAIPSGTDHPWAERLHRPVPRLEEGRAIAAAGGSAAIDISDGLLLDLSRLCCASGVGARLDTAAVPRPAAAEWQGSGAQRVAPEQLEKAALGGGDDYELCFTIREPLLTRLDELWPEYGADYCVIGEIFEGSGIEGPDGRLDPAGWDHVASGRRSLE